MSGKSFSRTYRTELNLTADGVNTKVVGTYPNFSFVRTGSNNPNYRSAVRLGENASGNMTVTVTDVTFDRLWDQKFWYQTSPYTSQNYHHFETKGVLHPYWSPMVYGMTVDWERRELQRASESFLKRLREADRKFQAGVFFGEIVPTIKMLVRPFDSLRSGIRDYFRAVHKRGRGHKGPKLRKILGDTWLEFAFGWQPLLADIQDASGAAIDIYANLRKERITSKVGGQESSQGKYEGDSTVNLVFYKIQSESTHSYSVKFYGALNPLPNADAGIPYLKRIQNESNFNLSSFVPTVWELIPYSFLVDYFTNIGDVLAAYSTDTSELQWLSQVEIREAIKTLSYEVDSVRQYIGTVGYPPGKEVTPPPLTKMGLQGQGGATSIRYKNIIRWPFGSLTYPGLRFELPLSDKKFANMGALLAGSRKYRG